MNPLTTTPPELMLPLLRADAAERIPPFRPRPPRSLRRRIGRTMVAWGARLAAAEELTTSPPRWRPAANPA